MELAKECHILLLLLISLLCCHPSSSFHGGKSYQPLQVRLDRPSWEDGKDNLVWSPTYHTSSVPLSQDQVHNIILSCSFSFFPSLNMLSFCCCIFLLTNSYYKFLWHKATQSCPKATVFSVKVPLRSGAFGFPRLALLSTCC